MERIEITQELRKEIHTQIDLAEKGNGYGDGFDSVPFFGKFVFTGFKQPYFFTNGNNLFIMCEPKTGNDVPFLNV